MAASSSIVVANQPSGENRIMVFEQALARVMSPTGESREYVNAVLPCQVCKGMVSCEFICIGCGLHGHPPCIRLEQFLDYLFCPSCMFKAMHEYTSFQDDQRRHLWKGRLSIQVFTWRSRVTEVIGMSSTIGVAVGGALVAVAGVASGLAHGVVRGASVGSNVVQLALRAANEDQESTTYLSVGDSVEADRQVGRPPEGDRLTARPTKVATPRRGGPRCAVCWFPHVGNVRPIFHTHTGDCKLAPVTPSVAAASAAAPGSDVKN